MKIGIDMGHTISGPNYGAVGIRKESEETRAVGNLVIKKLEEMGHTVVNCTVDKAASSAESLKARVDKANSSNIDIFVCIHFNASDGRGRGTEVYTYGGKQIVEASSILKSIIGLGFINRGIKDGSHLYVIKNTKVRAMLVECCFIDNEEDMNRYNPKDMANAIVTGINQSEKKELFPNENFQVIPVITPGEENKVEVVAPPVVQEVIKPPVQQETKPPIADKNQEKKNLIKILQSEVNRQGFGRLDVDGIVGPKTIAALPTLKKGSKGEITKTYQKLLVLRGYSVGTSGADGVFGNDTHSATIRFQKDTGLSADGIVGKNTWYSIANR